MRNLLRGDTSIILPNLKTLGLFLDTFPDGWVAGRTPLRWRKDNSASSDQAELDFAWVCLSLVITRNMQNMFKSMQNEIKQC